MLTYLTTTLSGYMSGELNTHVGSKLRADGRLLFRFATLDPYEKFSLITDKVRFSKSYVVACGVVIRCATFGPGLNQDTAPHQLERYADCRWRAHGHGTAKLLSVPCGCLRGTVVLDRDRRMSWVSCGLNQKESVCGPCLN